MANFFYSENKSPKDFVKHAKPEKKLPYYQPCQEKVECRECGKQCCNISIHLFRSHPISSRDYRLKYGLKKSDLICSGLLEKRQQSIKNRAKTMSEKGRKNRDTYWAKKESRIKKSKQQSEEMNMRWNKKPETMVGALKNLVEMAKNTEKSKAYRKLKKECFICGKTITPKQFTRSQCADTKKFMKIIVCEKDCRSTYTHLIRSGELKREDLDL
jgi:hypothetical protein